MKKYIFDIILEGIDGEGITKYYRYTGDYNKILEIVEDDKLAKEKDHIKLLCIAKKYKLFTVNINTAKN